MNSNIQSTSSHPVTFLGPSYPLCSGAMSSCGELRLRKWPNYACYLQQHTFSLASLSADAVSVPKDPSSDEFSSDKPSSVPLTDPPSLRFHGTHDCGQATICRLRRIRTSERAAM